MVSHEVHEEARRGHTAIMAALQPPLSRGEENFAWRLFKKGKKVKNYHS